MDNTTETSGFWMYGPNGEAQIFSDVKDVPKGWKDTPALFTSPEAQNDTVASNQASITLNSEPVATVPEETSGENSTDIPSTSKKKAKK